MLTGEIRFRTNWRGKLILQIEETYISIDDRDPRDLGQYQRRWRDAKTIDGFHLSKIFKEKIL